MTELYRKNAAIIVCNTQGKVLSCQRVENSDFNWQFPQGGIEPNEEPLQAALRELREETGLTQVKLIAEYPQPLRYKFSDEVIEKFKKLGRKNIGQEQYWFLFLFSGNDNEIDFKTNPEEIEFKAFDWIDITEATARVVDFKREVYQKVCAYFKPFVEQQKKQSS